MKQKLLLVAFTLFGSMLFSQSQNMAFEDWKTTAGTQNFFYKNVTKTDGFGNIYVAGATVNAAGNYDILLAKYNSAGVQLWIQQYAGAGNGTDYAAGIAVTDTYVILTGAVCTSTTSPTTDAITMKYSSAGVFQWATTYNGAGNSFDSGKIPVIDASGNIYITGGSYNASANVDFVTIKYNSSGTQQWVSTYDYSSHLDDSGLKVVISGSNLTVTGAVTSATNSYKYATLTYAQSNGSLTASNISTVTTTSSITAVTDLTTDASANVYIVGSSYVSGQGFNYYVQKLSNTLVTAWTYTFNGTSSLDDVARAVQVDASGNVYISGYSTSSTQGRDIVTIKLNSSGTFQWNQTINGAVNGDDEGADMILDASANLYLTGYQTVSANNTDYYTIKYNSSTGAKIWDIFTDGNHLNDQATNMTLDSLNNVIVTGQSSTAPSTYNFLTTKYVQKDVITPTDFNGETPNSLKWYYPNMGQLVNTGDTLVPDIKFYTYQTYPAFYFKDHSQSYVFSRKDTIHSTTDTLQRIDLTFNSAIEAAKTYPMEQQNLGYLNYYLSYTGSDGITGVKGNKRLITTNLYNNIDLMSSSNQNGIKYYFIVKPGADMRNIQMEFTGATSFSLNGTTNALSINSSIGSITFDKPIAYQLTSSNATVAVTSFSPTWTTNGASNKYIFNSGTYTSSLTLIIEVDQGNGPLSSTSTNNPVWCTDVGSPNYDQVWGIDSDVNGYLYATGYTMDQTFPHTTGIYNAPGGGGSQDAFLLKYAPGGTPQWRMIYGGTETDQGERVKVDNNNNCVYMVGFTSDPNTGHATNFPLQNNGGYYHTPVATGTSNVLMYGFITKFNMVTGIRSWGTLFGDDAINVMNETLIYGIDVASNGELYIGGATSKQSNFPIVTPSNGCAVHSQNTSNVLMGFVAKFSSSNGLVWSTLFGNDGTVINDLRVNSQNELFMTGVTGSTNASSFPMHKEFSNDYYHTFAGGNTDAFVTKFSACLELKWSTLVGGASDETGNAIEISEGSPASSKTANTITYTYISGNTKSTNSTFPIMSNGNTNSINDNSLGGTQDAFIAGFDGANQQTWTTYVGGSNIDELNDMEFGRAGTLFLTGSTKSTDFLNTTFTGAYNQTQLENTAGGNDYDAVIMALDGRSTFTKVWSSWFGGNTSLSGYRSDDYGYGITTSGTIVYMGGRTWSFNDFPWNVNSTTYPAAYYQPYLEGNFSQDGFLAQFDLSLTPILVKELIKNDEDGFVVYPNPSDGMVYILLNEDLVKENQKLNIQVFDIQGREILTKPVTSIPNEHFSLNLSNLSTGMYFVKLSGENLNKSQKVIINH